MSRYIDEKDVYSLVEPNGLSRVHCSQIDELPRADVVEVVRCKDCNFARKMVSGDYSCCVDHRLSHDENDYCSYGKRRTE